LTPLVSRHKSLTMASESAKAILVRRASSKIPQNTRRTRREPYRTGISGRQVGGNGVGSLSPHQCQPLQPFTPPCPCHPQPKTAQRRQIWRTLQGRRAPKNWHSEIPGFRPASDVLEIGPEWRRLRRPRDRDAEAETCPEAGNPVTRRCQSGRSPGAVGEIRGSGEVRVEGF